MKSDVIIQQLFIKVLLGDSSYKPQHVVISAGSDLNDLREINNVRIPRYTSYNSYFFEANHLSLTAE